MHQPAIQFQSFHYRIIATGPRARTRVASAQLPVRVFFAFMLLLVGAYGRTMAHGRRLRFDLGAAGA